MNILITEPDNYSKKALEIYSSLGKVSATKTLSREELLAQIPAVEVLVIRLAHQIDAQIIDAAPNLIIIASPTTGLNHIDVAYAEAKGIKVVSLKGETEFLRTVHATAELTMALMLALIRKLPWNFEAVKAGKWDRDASKGTELAGKTLGIIGCGRLGRKVVGYGRAFDMRVIAYDPIAEEVSASGAEFASFEKVLRESDIISVHVPLNDATKNLIGEKEFNLMKQGAFFINTSRGEIVDERALLSALQNNHLLGAALDVLADELPWGETKMISGNGTSTALVEYSRSNKNLILTSHIGGATVESMEKTENFIAEKVTLALRHPESRIVVRDKLREAESKDPESIEKIISSKSLLDSSATHQNDNVHFDSKWDEILKRRGADEFTLFVPKGESPHTQRQFNLYNYFAFIRNVVEGHHYKSSLELGAGRGTISLYLKKYLGFDVTLNDMSGEAMDLAKANFEFFKEKAEFSVSDATKLPFPDNSFDVVTSIGLMEHLTNYSDILKEAYRVLKPGGVMVQINIPKKESIQILNRGYRKILSWFDAPLRPDFPRNTDRPEDYARNATAVGFINVTTTNVNPFPLFVPLTMPIDRILAKLYRAILSLRGMVLNNPFHASYAFSQCHFLVGWKK